MRSRSGKNGHKRQKGQKPFVALWLIFCFRGVVDFAIALLRSFLSRYLSFQAHAGSFPLAIGGLCLGQEVAYDEFR
jgi:hypothetical protein